MATKTQVDAQPSIEIVLTTAQRIARTQEEISRRKTEADSLEKQAAEIAMVDSEKSIALDAQSVATRRYAERLEKSLEELRAREQAERLSVQDARIDEAAAAEFAAVSAHVEQMKAVVPEISAAIKKFLALPQLPEMRGDPEGIHATKFLKLWFEQGGMTEEWGLRMLDGVVDLMRGRLGRGAGMLKRGLRGADEYSIGTNEDSASGASRINARLQGGY